jgi:hypothetical protein
LGSGVGREAVIRSAAPVVEAAGAGGLEVHKDSF